MSNKQKAYGDLLRFAEMFSGVLGVAKELSDIGSIEQAADEAKTRLNSLREEEEQAKTSRDSAVSKLEALEVDYQARMKAADAGVGEVQSQANKSLSDAVEAGKRAISDAEAKAAAIIKSAEADADYALKSAQKTAQAAEQTAKARLAAVNRDIGIVDAALEARKGVLADVENRLTAANAELAALKKRFE